MRGSAQRFAAAKRLALLVALALPLVGCGDDGLWARVVYDFALGHRQRVMDRGQLLRSLTPIYLGWLAGFVAECGGQGPEAVEARVERLCLAFEAEKPYLISRWRWPDRFNP